MTTPWFNVTSLVTGHGGSRYRRLHSPRILVAKRYQRVPGWKPWWPRLQLVAQQWPNATTVKRLGTLPFPPLKALRCSSHALKHPDLRPYLVQCTLTATHIHRTTTANRTEHASSTQDVPAVDCHHHLCRRSHYFLTFCPGCVLRISSSEAFRWAPDSRWLGHTCSGNTVALTGVAACSLKPFAPARAPQSG